MITLQKPRINERTAEVRSIKYRLVAQGDSWFDYPGADIIDCLRNTHGQDIENISISRSSLEDIVGASADPVGNRSVDGEYAGGAERMADLLDLIGRAGDSLNAVLLSAGGNDLAGPGFTELIDAALLEMEDPGRRVSQTVRFWNLRIAYRKVFRAVIRKGRTTGARLHIFVHGYDYPWPDGRGLEEQGPWFHEAFNSKGFLFENDNAEQLRKRRAVVKVLVDNLNEMLVQLTREPEFAGLVHHVDLRNTLRARSDWANELHPTEEGFAKLAVLLDQVIQQTLYPWCSVRELSGYEVCLGKNRGGDSID